MSFPWHLIPLALPSRVFSRVLRGGGPRSGRTLRGGVCCGPLCLRTCRCDLLCRGGPWRSLNPRGRPNDKICILLVFFIRKYMYHTPYKYLNR